MSYNIYYNPEKLRLEIFDQLNESGLCYEYNTLLIVLHKKSGRLFYETDSGCSCPTPFDNYNFECDENGNITTNLIEITQGSLDHFIQDVENFPVSINDRGDCIDRVKKYLKGR